MSNYVKTQSIILKAIFFVAIFVVAFLFFTKDSKAQLGVITDFYTIDGGVITITEDTEDTLMVCVTGMIGGNSFTLDGVNSTNYYNYEVGDGWASLSYIKEPKSGNSNFSINSGNNYGDFSCFLVTNFDTSTTPTATHLNASEGYTSSFDFTIQDTHENDFLVLTPLSQYQCNNNVVSNASSTLVWSSFCNSNWGKNQVFMIEANETAPINYTYSIAGGNTKIGAVYLDIKSKEEEGGGGGTWAEDDYIMYYDENPIYKPIGTPFNLPFVFNLSNHYYNNSLTGTPYTAKLIDNSTGTDIVLATKTISTKFSGTETISFLSLEDKAFTPRIAIYYGETLVEETNRFFAISYTEILETTEHDISNLWHLLNNNYLTYTTNTKPATTTIPFGYTFCSGSFDFSVNDYKVCLIDNTFTTLNGCSNVLTSCGGIDNLIFTLPETDNTTYTYYLTLIDDNNDSVAFASIDQRNKIILYVNNEPILNITSSSGIDNRNPIFAFSWGFFGQMIDSGLKVLNTGFKILTEPIKYVFPFNFLTAINNAWHDSAMIELPENLLFFRSINENDQVYITIPANWHPTRKNTDIVVFGSSIFNYNDKTTAFFSGVRVVSRYLLWGMFFILLWNFALKVFADITGKAVEEIDREEMAEKSAYRAYIGRNKAKQDIFRKAYINKR